MSWVRAGAIVEGWIRRVQAWFVRETGHTFDYDYRILYSNRNIYELALDELDGCSLAPVPEGQGLAWGVLWSLLRDEIGWSTTDDNRYWTVVVGAGGWAGGGLYPAANGGNVGVATCGDWGLRYEGTGQPDPCCMQIWGEGLCTADPAGCFGHELLHAMKVDCHNPVVDTDDVLSDTQRVALVQNNADYLYPPTPTRPAAGLLPVVAAGLVLGVVVAASNRKREVA